MKREGTVVIGAGLTGLSFAYHFDGAVAVFERELTVGGLVRTLEVGSYRFDLAPHLLHLRSDYAKSLVFDELGLRTHTHTRRARIYFGGKIIPYPFELNLYEVNSEVRRDCLEGLAAIDPALRSDDDALRRGSYRDYALNAFGTGIADHYLLPYNRKIWDTDPGEMTCEWMRYLPTADAERIIENAGAPNTDSFGYNTEFHYPATGIQELPGAFAARVPDLRLGQELLRIDTERRVLTFKNGSSVGYDRLISTIPLRTLIERSDLEDLRDAAATLVNTHVYTVNVVVRGRVPDAHWMYFPDPALPFYRISFPRNYFPGCAPADHEIIAVEVASREPQDVRQVEARVLRAIADLPIFAIDEIVFVHSIPIPVAYCIYTPERTATVERLRSELVERDVHSVGRYGAWEYSAMEDAILYGRELARELQGIASTSTASK